jgi:hypothetical protein
LQEIHNNSDLDPAKLFWDNLKKWEPDFNIEKRS